MVNLATDSFGNDFLAELLEHVRNFRERNLGKAGVITLRIAKTGIITLKTNLF